MRTHRWTLVFAAAALLAGCGDRHLVLNVDVLSYLNPDDTLVSFGPVPAVPGGIYTGEQSVVKDATMNLLDGASSAAEVQSVSLAMTTIASDSTGSGADTLRLYLSDPETDPLSTSPVMLLPITLTAGMPDTSHVEFQGDERVAELFRGKRVRITLTTALRGPDSGESLNGRVRISEIGAVMVAGRKGGL